MYESILMNCHDVGNYGNYGKCSSDFLFECSNGFDNTERGFDMQYLHVIILVSTAVMASSLCRAHHNELPLELLLLHEQESLF